MSTYVNDKFKANSAYLTRHLRYNDYVEKGKTVEGRWIGKACEAFGVQQGAVVREEEFNALRDNEHAVSHEQLTVRHNTTKEETYVDKEGKLQTREVNNRKPFADMTTGAPKTSSVGALVFKSELIRGCHSRAISKMLLEAEAITGRQAHNGREHVVVTANFCAAAYEHTSNRCLEPQLHQHTIIFNATQDAATGKNYAVEFGEFANQSRYLTAVYWDTLSAELQAIGAQVEIDEHGAPQIVALKEYEESFSRRTKEIEDLIERIEELAGTKLSDRECKSITLASRGFRVEDFERVWERNKAELDGLKTLDPEKAEGARRKILDRFTAIVRNCSQDDLVQISAAEVEALQQGLLTDEQKARGLAFVASLSPRVKTVDRSRDIEADITFAIEHLFANQSVVKEYDLWKEILLHAQGKNVDITQMKAAVRAHPGLVFGQGNELGPADHYKREMENMLWVEEGKGRGVAIEARGLSEQLNESQRQAVKELLECRDQFSMLYGIHGVGKTFSLSEVARRYLEGGHRVFVLAPENGARDVLRKDGEKMPPGAAADIFKRTQNLSEFLVNPKWRRDLGPGALVILDEAGMSNLEDLNNFMRLARERSFGVLLSGDVGQLTSVAAGDGFRILKEKSSIHVSELKEIIRQAPEALDGHYLKAAQLLGEKKKKVRDAMWELYQAGCIKEMKGDSRIEYYADRVMESLDGSKPAVMSNITHRENDAVAESVRARRKQRGELTDERTFTVHRTLGWTASQKKEIDKLQVGQILQITRGADKGRAWKVVGVSNGKALTEDASGQRREFFKRHAGMFDVCEQREIPVASGDHLRLYSGGRETTNGELFIPAAWDTDGNPVNADGKTLTSRNFTYGYTGTVRKVQGSTQPKNISGLDRKSIRAATAEIATVACTRGRNDIEIIVESIADIAQIENKSSQRKAVCEMALEHGALPADARELVTRIEQARSRSTIEHAREGTLDLQSGARRARHDKREIAHDHKAMIKQSHYPDIHRMDQQRERGPGIER